jgi:hypothetical protein
MGSRAGQDDVEKRKSVSPAGNQTLITQQCSSFLVIVLTLIIRLH